MAVHIHRIATTRLCECPATMRRSWKWLLSAMKGLLPLRMRRIEVTTRSRTGMNMTARGSRMGSRPTSICCLPSSDGSIWPVTMMPPAASTRPIVSAPPPIMIDEGWKLNHRNPVHTPTRAMTINEAAVA